MGDFAFIRNNNMKMGQLNNSYRHNERLNKRYGNDAIDETKSVENYHFKQPQGSYEQTFWKIKEENNYLGNLRLQGAKQSNVACEFIIDVNKDYFERIGAEKTRQYYKDAYDFCVKKCGEKNIISATVHMDEGHPHMHVVYVPVVKAKDRKGQDCERINCSKFWEGKDSYRQLQNQFYQHMQERGYVDLQRGEFVEKTQREHLSVDEYKVKQSKEKQAELDRLKKIDTSIEPPQKKIYLPKDIEELKTLTKSANLKRYEVKMENISLKEENDSLKKKNINLKELVKDMNSVTGENKDLKNEKKILKDYFQQNPEAHSYMKGYFDRMEQLQKERSALYNCKAKYLTNTRNIHESQKLVNNLKEEIDTHKFFINDLKERKSKIHDLEIKLDTQKQKRDDLGGLKSLFKRSEKKEVDKYILELKDGLKMAKNDLKMKYEIEPTEIDHHIDIRNEKISVLKDKLQDQEQKIIEYAELKYKAEINYKYFDVKSKCYKDYEREYVLADAEKIKADVMELLPLDRLSAKEKEVIFKQIPEELKNKAKEVLDPPRMARMVKSIDRNMSL